MKIFKGEIPKLLDCSLYIQLTPLNWDTFVSDSLSQLSGVPINRKLTTDGN